MAGAEFIRVTARIRPSNVGERIVTIQGAKTVVFNSCEPKHFKFDSVFDESITQEKLFEDIGGRIIDGCVEGYNGTIFAYGTIHSHILLYCYCTIALRW
ncbi:hypothetical protein DICVIV_14224 [Dictyocaulus viviparus]|uniref:Kinesin motor domain-containing protein n=1 Tax=Dictyocaulus viviparus TaxID=29172 RepID=A0A0D8X7W7_DICVI|nr:hypothetical protein DICVIV_14224 [Dictyocaulus viviparus]